jgi:sugar lactone lactonase YvrE
MRTTSLRQYFAFGLSAAFAFVAHDAAANTIAYAELFLGGGFDFDRIDFSNNPPVRLGSLDMLAISGAFVGDDFSTEYILDARGNLYSVDVRNAGSTTIRSVSTAANTPMGLHWDPTSDQMFLVANDESCATSTLYHLNISDASTVEVGSTPGCIIGLAIDADGHAFGIDQAAEALVSIDTTTGAATPIGPLGFSTQPTIGGFDFDPESGLLYLFATDLDAGIRGMYLVDTTLGDATLVWTYNLPYLGLAFAQLSDSIFANGLDP